MNLPGNNLARVKQWCEERGTQTFTDMGIDALVKVPRTWDVLKNAILIFNGNRPEETQEEVIKYHCEILGLTYWKTLDYKNLEILHHFKIRNESD